METMQSIVQQINDLPKIFLGKTVHFTHDGVTEDFRVVGTFISTSQKSLDIVLEGLKPGDEHIEENIVQFAWLGVEKCWAVFDEDMTWYDGVHDCDLDMSEYIKIE